MQTFIDFLNVNPWLNLLFLILAVGSIVVSVMLYLRSRKEKILVYMTRSFNLIHNSVVRVPGLLIQYEGNAINTLTLTKFALWNKGKGTINSSDIAFTDKISILTKEDIKILDATIAYKSRDANNFSLEKTASGIIIHFDYIDFYQGVIIDVYHNGQSVRELIIGGTVKGGHDLAPHIPSGYLFNKVIRKLSTFIPAKQNRFIRFLFALIITFIFLIPLTLIIFIDALYSFFNKLPSEFDLSSKE